MIDINLINTTDTELGEKVSGIQLLAQRVIIILQTKASDPLRRDEGCDLIDLLGTSQVDPVYVGALLSSVVSDIVSIMAEDSEDFSDDETLDTAYISDLILNGDSVEFTLNVISKSGSKYSVTSTIGDTL